jgi:multidrug efflux pump subunit AcrA (membrane-fusion protein)
MRNRKITSIFILLLFTVLLFLTACSSITSTPTTSTDVVGTPENINPMISATGIVVPETYAILSFPMSGVVDQIQVSEDDIVEKGQLLAQMSGSEQFQAALAAAQLQLISAQQSLDKLNEDPELRTALAESAVVQAKSALDDAQKRLNTLNEASDIADIDQARASVVLAKDRLDKAQEDYAPYKNKSETNLIRAALLSKVAKAQQDYDAAVRRLNNLLGGAADLDLAQAQANLNIAQAQLLQAERKFEILKDGPDPADIALVEAQIASAQEQLDAAQKTIDDLTLEAPFDGSIVEVYVKPDEWVMPGQRIMLIADLNALQIETTDLNEIDAAQVAVGAPVKVTFDAFPGLETQGKVYRIASKASEGTGVNYKVIIKLDEIPPQLRWGMTSFVDIQPTQ